MEPRDNVADDFDQPVAYDTEGRPLYAHPAQSSQSAQPGRPESMVASQAVHMARPVEIAKPFVSDATKIKHDRSRRLYPTLNLSEGEYVIIAVRRHPIGLFGPFGVALILLAVAISVMFNYDVVVQVLRLKGLAADGVSMIFPILMFILLVCLLTYVAYYVYTNNRFYLTNESIIEQTQASLFARTEKAIDLASIEDVSYSQTNMLQTIFDYGSIRLSTIGDETSYRYNYVANPKHQVETLNNAVEAFKNGRPVI